MYIACTVMCRQYIIPEYIIMHHDRHNSIIKPDYGGIGIDFIEGPTNDTGNMSSSPTRMRRVTSAAQGIDHQNENETQAYPTNALMLLSF